MFALNSGKLSHVHDRSGKDRHAAGGEHEDIDRGCRQPGADELQPRQAEIPEYQPVIQEGVDRPRPSVVYDIGEEVKVIDGPFASFNGIVEDLDEEKAKLKVSVSIFGRATPVELEFTQVEKSS